MGIGEVGEDLFRRAVLDLADGVEVAREAEVRSDLAADLFHRLEIIHVEEIHPEFRDLLELPLDVPADVEADARAGRMDGIHDLLLTWGDFGGIVLRADEGSGGVAEADEIGSCGNLGAGEIDFHPDNPVHQVADKVGFSRRLEEDVVNPAEVGGLGEGALDPALNRDGVPDLFAVELDGGEAVGHSSAALRVGFLQFCEVGG